MTAFRKWCRELPENDPVREKVGWKGDYLQYMLESTKKKEEFEKMIESEAGALKKHKEIKEKFNGTHIMDMFGVSKQKLN